MELGNGGLQVRSEDRDDANNSRGRAWVQEDERLGKGITSSPAANQAHRPSSDEEICPR